MTHRDKALELFNHFFDSDNGGYGYVSTDESKKQAVFIVNEIIKALETTTGYCELRKIDWHEVQNDFKYWNDVINEINQI